MNGLHSNYFEKQVIKWGWFFLNLKLPSSFNIQSDLCTKEAEEYSISLESLPCIPVLSCEQ